MKLNAAFRKSLLAAASAGLLAGSLWAQTPARSNTVTTEEPAAPAAEEAEPSIPGTMIPRANGGFLSLEVERNTLKLSFYDAKRKQTEPDVARATARWDPKYKQGQERRVLNPAGDGKSLTSAPIRPPYQFKVFLNLLSEDGDAVESYTVDFKG
jgi:hypothetical protein